MAICVLLTAAIASRAQSRIEVKGRWSDDAHKAHFASVVVNCYRAAKTCTVVSTVDDDLMSDDHEVVRWDSERIVAIGGGDCVTNTLLVNLSRKAVSMSFQPGAQQRWSLSAIGQAPQLDSAGNTDSARWRMVLCLLRRTDVPRYTNSLR